MSDKRKALIVHITTIPASFTFLRGQIKYMKERGLEVVGISSPGDEIASYSEEYEITIHIAPMTRAITPLSDIISMIRVCRLIRKIKPDIVHSHTLKGGLIGMISAFVARAPVRIYHLRGLRYPTLSGFKLIAVKSCEKLTLRLAHRVICVSNSVKDKVASDRLCPPDKVKVMAGGSGNGVDADNRFNPDNIRDGTRDEIRKIHNVPSEAFVVGFVGRLVKDKGIVELIEAWDLLSKKYDSAYLLLAGEFEEEDPLPEPIKERILKESRIRYVGLIKGVEKYYAAMDLLILPSHREGFPNVVLEASAMKLPVIATEALGCKGAVVDGLTGTLVPIHDSLSIMRAIISYMEDRNLCKTRGEAGRERVIRDFQPKKIWEGIYNEYADLIGERMKAGGIGRPSVSSLERRSDRKDPNG